MFRQKWVAWLLVGAIALGTVAVPLTAYAAPKTKAELANTPLGRLIVGTIGRLLVLRSELNVTDEQRAKIREVLVGHKPEIAKEVKAVWVKRNALRDLVLSGKGDEAAIRQAADELGKAIGDAAVLGAKIRGEVAPILTDEQRELIKKFRQDNDQAATTFFQKATKAE